MQGTAEAPGTQKSSRVGRTMEEALHVHLPLQMSHLLLPAPGGFRTGIRTKTEGEAMARVKGPTRTQAGLTLEKEGVYL